MGIKQKSRYQWIDTGIMLRLIAEQIELYNINHISK